ncbi:CubicO group peptidase (beta-lactamase class C family) [Dyadobacter sp. BE34]|uniref:CubicO group peptidase (Beta-lactamase class C family) n=1 Tax=Dyadobacter fermentans TaxID=94254 RepID=A0ABU1R0I1_9BACT|nr:MULTISPECIES: serine hydrolase domain-containing protein [Dyadobacter]MDR6806913.1 CubicO group peptidase (beta-lactamase class C family) [Dyadobacter fermentans]MDR7044655.1 CubicO group peptidase (beta-lactamase class C family) [Dyadobacter sp. BE242]MDR7198965.1 CubicO group peptidase (beta-lactamase class C family) [Dyadobacter sp. BE34]MDR7216927.1 CubicO group peptidase (beta-lactamase class C family) [Dyadobacter sp. BE31]MDR7263547.1 CubicO group peptidase (beta-lactamase class C fa
MKCPLLFVAFSLLIRLANAQTLRTDSLVTGKLKELHIPGLAAAKVENGNISWTRYYGYQDIARQIPVTDSTVFHIASISKTVTAAAIMQLEAKGYFKLDDDINRFLPFRVANPSFQSTPITFRQLLRHRSSIADNMDYLLPFWENEYKGPDIPLETFLRDYLSTTGKRYRADKNFVHAEPGSEFAYSNMGFALLGYLVQRIAKMPFDQYCKMHVFSPLAMRSTSWFLEPLQSDRLAVPYQYSDSLDRYEKLPQGKYPDYPAGQLSCTVNDLARFLACWSNDGAYDGKRIIGAASVQRLTPKDMSLGFHTWFMYLLNTETPLYSHNGHGPGVSTYMLYDPFSKKGLIILMNGELSGYLEWRKLIGLLWDS